MMNAEESKHLSASTEALAKIKQLSSTYDSNMSSSTSVTTMEEIPLSEDLVEKKETRQFDNTTNTNNATTTDVTTLEEIPLSEETSNTSYAATTNNTTMNELSLDQEEGGEEEENKEKKKEEEVFSDPLQTTSPSPTPTVINTAIIPNPHSSSNTENNILDTNPSASDPATTTTATTTTTTTRATAANETKTTLNTARKSGESARIVLSSKEMEFYGQLHRALDYGDNDSIVLKDVVAFLKRSKLPDHIVQKAWKLAAESNISTGGGEGSQDSDATPKLFRHQFFICLKLIALAQYKAFNGEDGAKISLLQLVMESNGSSPSNLPLPNFGIRACAAEEALTPRHKIDAIQNDVTTSRGGLSIHITKHETTDHTSYQMTLHVDRGATGLHYSEYPADDVVVWRRYNDFRWLYETLCIRYPGTIIPPLPAAKAFGNLDFSFIKERKAELEFFIQSIVTHPILQKSFFLKIFLVSSRRGMEAAFSITNESKRILSAVVGAEAVGSNSSNNIDDASTSNRVKEKRSGGNNTLSADISSTTSAATEAVANMFTWAYGRIKEKVTDQITMEPEDITNIVGMSEEAAYNGACAQLTVGTADLASVVASIQSMLLASRERTYQLFLVGESLQQLSQMEFDRGNHHKKEMKQFANFEGKEGSSSEEVGVSDSLLSSLDPPVIGTTVTSNNFTTTPATTAIEYPSDLSEVGNMLETLANLETELHDDTVQRFLTPIRQCAAQTEAARVVLDNYARIVEELGRARASAKHYKNVYKETKLKVGQGGGRLSPSSTERAEEESNHAKRMEGEAYRREMNAKEQLRFVVSNFPHEVDHMKTKCSTVLGGVLLERGRAQIQHEKQTRLELERVRDALLVGDTVDENTLKLFHQWRDQQLVPPPLPGYDEIHNENEKKVVSPRFDAEQKDESLSESAASTAAALMGKVSNWFG
jgi:hypothetical protein